MNETAGKFITHAMQDTWRWILAVIDGSIILVTHNLLFIDNTVTQSKIRVFFKLGLFSKISFLIHERK